MVLLGSLITFCILRPLKDWPRRRMIQFFVLTMPLATLGLSLGGFHHFMGPLYFKGVPLWDVLLGVVLPLAMVLVGLGALFLTGVRLFLMASFIAQKKQIIANELQATVYTLAR